MAIGKDCVKPWQCCRMSSEAGNSVSANLLYGCKHFNLQNAAIKISRCPEAEVRRQRLYRRGWHPDFRGPLISFKVTFSGAGLLC
jgi:hypothetical protein